MKKYSYNIESTLKLFSSLEHNYVKSIDYWYYGAMNDEEVAIYKKSKYGKDYFIFVGDDLAWNAGLLFALIKMGLIDYKKYSVKLELELFKKRSLYSLIGDEHGLIFFVKGFERPTFFDIYKKNKS